MLELRPTCENCNTALPPSSEQARVCSFECTFCADCVERVLKNVCPNCGGGFAPRPIRPARNWLRGHYLGEYPASMATKHRPVDEAAHAALLQRVGDIPPAHR
jgi:hypothetical protein